MNNIDALEKAIGYVFEDKKLADQAFTHASYNPGTKDNSMLAILGVNALLLAAAEEIMRRNIETAHLLSKLRDGTTNDRVLLEVAGLIGAEDYLLFSDTLRSEKSFVETFSIASVKALAGAIFLEGGYEALKGFARRFLFGKIKDAQTKDAKTLLQEFCQGRYGVAPQYFSLSSGPEHQKIYRAEVYCKDVLLGSGRGRTKKDAEKDAAQSALNGIIE